jgi:O-methyltransferase
MAQTCSWTAASPRWIYLERGIRSRAAAGASLTMLARRLARLLNFALKPIGVELRRIGRLKGPTDPPVWDRVGHLIATSKERVHVLCDAVEHVVRNGIEGAFVECGVWRGGSTMAAALTFLQLGETNRDLHLFDTFEGMPPPTKEDRVASSGEAAISEFKGRVFCYSSLEDVRENIASTGYDMSHVYFHRGMVENTVPECAPPKIAILRLDTDWYSSTKHELKWLYPLVVPGGFLIIDDYGHFTGARQATDEFFGGRQFLFRIDYSGRLVMKQP